MANDLADVLFSAALLTYTPRVCIHLLVGSMAKRINVTLPEETIRVLDRVAAKGNRSRLISEAVIHYVSSRAKRNLAEQLKQGALANSRRDLELAHEWFSIDEEAWQRTKSTAKSPAKRNA
jgi:CopG family transcriptional regulator / antitoxin EndoAI